MRSKISARRCASTLSIVGKYGRRLISMIELRVSVWVYPDWTASMGNIPGTDPRPTAPNLINLSCGDVPLSMYFRKL
ncbi:hypothetical protein D3C71_2142360 [compost metagenome]